MKINNNNKVYVACPYALITGGPESLHQLVFELNNIGIDAYIFYYNVNKAVEVTEKYKKYTNKVAYCVEDKESNIIVIPETETQLLYKYRHIRKYIWWLSLDFYFRTMPNEYSKNNRFINKINSKNFKKIICPILKFTFILKERKFKILSFDNDKNLSNYIHLYNCEYVKEFLISKGIEKSKMYYLCGPISKDYISQIKIVNNKYNIVAYNPAKETEFYKKIIEYVYMKRDDILFFPIQNMDERQVQVLLRKSKVYIDFGFFPGPERIPREAVVSYCNIITSNKGSARNDVDILIPKDNKFNVDECIIDEVYRKIVELIDNYEENLSLYDSYREKVQNQIDRFSSDVYNIFCKIISSE